MFKKIGNYLMSNNLNIDECFDYIDTDDSKTISYSELR